MSYPPRLLRILIITLGLASALQVHGGPSADTIRSELGISQGLLVTVGVSDPGLLADLCNGGKVLVQALLAEEPSAEVLALRDALHRQGVYGGVSVRTFDPQDRLPYFANLVDVLVISSTQSIPEAEVLRVLRPLGKAYLLKSTGAEVITKPEDPRLGEWTHWFGGADSNPQNYDEVVGPIQGVQWHIPQAPLNQDVQFYAGGVAVEGGLVGRSAYNGIRYWSHPEDRSTRGARGDRTITSVCLDGDAAYGVLVNAGPLQRIDLQTGAVMTLDEGLSAPVQTVNRDLLVPIVVRDEKRLIQAFEDKVVALDPGTGGRLWEYTHRSERAKRAKLLSSEGGRVYIGYGDQPNKVRQHYRQVTAPLVEIASIDAETGQDLWTFTDFAPGRTVYTLLAHKGNLYLAFLGNNLVLQELIKLDGRTGRELKRVDMRNALGSSRNHQYIRIWNDRILITTGTDVLAYTLEFEPTDAAYTHPENDEKHSYGHCTLYRGSAFGQNAGQHGYLSFRDNTWYRSYITRSVCDSGPAPAYGMLYPTDPGCGCYMHLAGHIALRCAPDVDPEPVPDSARLERGVAFSPKDVPARWPASDEWPMYLRDPTRSNGSEGVVGASFHPVFTNSIPLFNQGPVGEDQAGNIDTLGRIGAPVVADGILFVAASDIHRLYAFDAFSGETRWTYDTGARIDTAPVIYRGLCLFGSRDGYVYALRASDGALVWRFLAAPRHRQMVVSGQLQSAWPVSSGVMVFQDSIYAVAGISSGSDDGLYLYRLGLDGSLLARQRITEAADMSADPGYKAPMAHFGRNTAELNDILSLNVRGDVLFLGKIAIHPKSLAWTSLYNYPDGRPIFPSQTDLVIDRATPGLTSYTRGTMFPSIYRGDTPPMLYGTANANARQLGILSKRDSRCIQATHWPMRHGSDLYVIERANQIYRFALSREGDLLDPEAREPALPAKVGFGTGTVVGNHHQRGYSQLTGNRDVWFLLGFSEGTLGPNVKLFRPDPGFRVREYSLPGPAVRNGMAVAYGHVYVCLNDGTVMAFDTQPGLYAKAPGSPAAFSATVRGTSRVDFAWDPTPGAERYALERSQDGATWTPFMEAMADQTQVRVFDMKADTNYQFRIRAENASGAGPWSLVAATTEPRQATP